MGDPAAKLPDQILASRAQGEAVVRQLRVAGMTDAEIFEEPPPGASADEVAAWFAERAAAAPPLPDDVRAALLVSIDESDLPESFRESLRRDLDRL